MSNRPAKTRGNRGQRRRWLLSAFEQLEERALLSTFYVDGSNLTGVEDGTQSHPFHLIQAAINASAAGDTVNVAPGTYAESLTIAHALTLRGPNAGINPNTGTRGAEATLIPNVNNPNSGRMILVTGNNVTIDGLAIDGHNAALSGGQTLNGISSNAASGVTNVDSGGNINVISGLVVQNDIIQNLTAFGVMADINDFSTSTLAVSTGNFIRDNKIDNLPVVSPVPGRGISIEDNFYADVTGNVITRAGTGIQAIFMLSPNPGATTSVISGNTISDYALGIYLWTMDSDQPAFNVNNNTITAEVDPQTTPDNVGIELDKILHTSAVSLSGNNVSGAHAGIELQYTPVSPTVTVTGGTLANNDYGVLITNSDVPTGDVPPKPVQGTLAGVTITGSKIAALDVVDALATAGATVTLNVDAATSLSGNLHGAVISGLNAHLVENVAPTLAFTGKPAAMTDDTTATFSFSASDNITTANDLVVQSSLDGAAFTAAASPVSFNGLALGAHTFVLKATDQAGNVQTLSYAWTITVGPPPPLPPSTPSLAVASDTGSSHADGITSDNTPTFSGTAPAGNTVTLFAGSTMLGTTTADSGGNWTFTVGGPGSLVNTLADGPYAITATDRNGTATSAPSGSFALVVDTTAPSATLTSTPPAQTSSGAAAFTFSVGDNSTPAGSLVSVYRLDGASSVSATSPVNLTGLGAGSHTFALTTTDLSGNATTTTYTWTIVAGASTFYVNAANTTGVEDGTQAHPYHLIQAAINASAAGDTVNVAPGTYAESLTIAHALTLRGPNAGINPNTGTRGAEATLIPNVNNPNSGRMILITASNVTIDGLFIDGHNAALSGGQVLNGISSNAATGIGTVDSNGTPYAVSGITVQDNVIQNLTGFGFIGDINDFSTSTLAVSTGNAIRDNRIDNIPVVSPVPGRGISIEHNFYADVTGNVITRAGTGIQAIFMLSPNPSPNPSVISGNTISDYALGIYLWTIDSDEPAFNVNNNTITTEVDPQTAPNNAGIELDKILHTSAVSLSGNNVSGAHAGIELQYTPVSPTVTVTGGTLANNDYGVLITNSDVPTGDVPPKPVQGTLAGVTITGSKIAALDVVDALATAGATVTLNVDAATSLSGNLHGAVISGLNAHLVESVLPVVTFTATPPAQTAAPNASFSFNASDNVTTANDLLLQYSLDGGAPTLATSPLNLSGLASGSHTLVLTATDQAGNSASASYQWTILAAAQPPSTPTLDTASDSGASHADGITNDNTPTFTGTAPAGNTVTLFDGGTTLGTTTADSGGNWTFTVGQTGAPVASLADGSHAITANDTDGLTTSASSLALNIVIDTVAPVLNITAAPPAQTSSNSVSIAFNTSDPAPASGSVDTRVATDGGTPVVATSPVTITVNPLALGSHSAVLTATDLAGNSTTQTVQWTLLAPPNAPSTPTLDTASDSGASHADGITNDNTPTFTGTAPAGNTVTLFVDSTPIGTTTADAGGNWTFTVGGPGSLVSTLADGIHAITAQDSDGVGTSATSGSLILILDTVAPNVTLTGTPPAQTASNSATFTFTDSDNSTPTINLTASYSLDGALPTPAGSPVNFSGLALGGHTFVLNVADKAGNVTSVPYAWTVTSLVPPAAPSVPSLSASSDSGTSSSDGITNDATPTFTGTAAPGSLVTLFAGTTTLGTTTANTQGGWTFTVGGTGASVPRLADGSYAITATARNGGGTSQPSGSRAIVIDTTPPTLQVTRSPQGNGNGWNNTNVVAVYQAADSQSGLASPATGSYTFSSQGAGLSHTFTVKDVAGNVANAVVGPVKLDKSAPAITLAVSPSTLRATAGGRVNLTISGQVVDSLSGPGGSVAYRIVAPNGQTLLSGSSATGSGGVYSIPLTLGTVAGGRNSTLAYSVMVTSSDAAGNAKTVKTTLNVRSGSLVALSRRRGKGKASTIVAHPQTNVHRAALRTSHSVPKAPAHARQWK